MGIRDYQPLSLLLTCLLFVHSCAIKDEKTVTGPLRLTKPVQSPGTYAYRRFDDGPFRNLIEVFALSSRESIGTLVAGDSQQQRVLGFAISPTEAKGIITLHQVPGTLHIFDLRENQWNSIILQRAPLGYAILQSNQPRAWLIDTGTPSILDVDLDSREILSNPDLSSLFDVLLPYMTISTNNRYLAVMGNSGVDRQSKTNLNSLAILELPSSKVISIHRLGNYPVNATFSSSARYVCTQLM